VLTPITLGIVGVSSLNFTTRRAAWCAW